MLKNKIIPKKISKMKFNPQKLKLFRFPPLQRYSQKAIVTQIAIHVIYGREYEHMTSVAEKEKSDSKFK